MPDDVHTTMRRAGAAGRRLARRLADDPGVTLVDVGRAPGSDEIVIRVHLSTEASQHEVRVPDRANGFRVITIAGDYRLDAGS